MVNRLRINPIFSTFLQKWQSVISNVLISVVYRIWVGNVTQENVVAKRRVAKRRDAIVHMPEKDIFILEYHVKYM